ncbi:MAG: N-acetyltransferase [Dehalococcoidales bacterium]|nr:N-acetyltransferase [Dehalococcoidales bacterium]
MGKGLSVMGNLDIRKAYVFDVEDILALINSCATSNLILPRGPKYMYENIRDFVVVEAQTEMGEPKIVACGSLHVLWKDTAEIRSLTTHPEFRGQGLGSKMVRYLVEDAKQIGIEKIIALTLIEEFFKKLGFKPKRKEELPSKVWDECSRCPKYFQCDEVGLILECSQRVEV